jgi:hypothetical protein
MLDSDNYFPRNLVTICYKEQLEKSDVLRG